MPGYSSGGNRSDRVSGPRVGRFGHAARAEARGPGTVLAVICALASFACGSAALAASGDDAGQTGRVSDEGRVRAIPADVPITRHYVNPATGEQRLLAGGLTDENLVYSNTPPTTYYLAMGVSDLAIADDIRTAAVGGCDMSAYEVTVFGGGDGRGPGFTATVAVFDACPHGGGQVIPGTEAVVPLGDDGLHTIAVDLSAAPITVGRTFWISVALDSGDAGWVFGTPADIGYTANRFDIVYTPCFRPEGGPYAGFHARVWCQPPFDREFLAYYNPNLTGIQYPLGVDRWLMDDIELIVGDCVLSSYEIGAEGTGGGEITVTAELRRECEPGSVIEGTQAASTFAADGAPKLARFEFPGGVDTGGGASFWIAYKSDRAASAIVAGQPILGATEDLFGILNNQQTCDFYWFGGNPYAGFAIKVNCLGIHPLGACCDLFQDGTYTCTQTPLLSCIYRHGRWAQSLECDDPTAFDPPCGTAACCTPPESIFGETCINATKEECNLHVDDDGHPAVWQRDQFCNEGQQQCVRWVCRFAEGPCDIAHPTVGCNVPTCCDMICEQDSYCCTVEWDDTCANRATGVVNGCENLPVANDDCWSPAPGEGAAMLNECGGSGAPCGSAHPLCPSGQICTFDGVCGGSGNVCNTAEDCPAGQLCLADGATNMKNTNAETDADETFCCHPNGAGTLGVGGVWAKFTATSTSARVHTCDENIGAAVDSLLQVYRATDHSSEQAACNSLVPIGCNDDGGCLHAGQASICLDDLTIGETYYVLLASKRAVMQGTYRLTITSPADASCADAGGEPVCPAGTVEWLDPPDGVVDARQPHELYDTGAVQGIDQIAVVAPFRTGPACWTVCDEGSANAVLSVEPGPACTSTLHLQQPLTAGAVTRIVYAGDGAPASFTSHPGNVDAGAATDADDIIALIDMINQVRPRPWGLYSCDIDHSGVCDPPDIIRLIDLLNGAGAFTPWFGTPLPTTTGDCP